MHDYKLKADDKIFFPKTLNINSAFLIDTNLKDKFLSWIVYEDDDIIAINKPAGVASQGGVGVKLSIDSLALQY